MVLQRKRQELQKQLCSHSGEVNVSANITQEAASRVSGAAAAAEVLLIDLLKTSMKKRRNLILRWKQIADFLLPKPSFY